MIKQNNYQCSECNLWYDELSWAKKCEVWCKKNPGSCNPEIISHIIK